MRANSKLVLFRRRLISFTYRVLNRLQFFPITLLYVWFNAALKLIVLRLGLGVVRVGSATGDVSSLPRDAMVWLGSASSGPPGHQFDVCLRLSRENAAAELHDVFSVALTFPRIQSVGLYWDSSSLDDDLHILQSKRDRSRRALTALHEEIGARGSTQLVEFLHSDHGELVLPVATSRDAQTLLKRYAGAADVVCLNLSMELRALADAVVRACPHIRFCHFSPEPPESAGAANSQSFFGWGLTLHERMALVQAADAYVGAFDELGCTAVISRRPAILLGGGSGVQPDRVSRDGIAVWLPGQPDPTALTKMVLQFLSDRLAARTK
jgi:hypothetical protein